MVHSILDPNLDHSHHDDPDIQHPTRPPLIPPEVRETLILVTVRLATWLVLVFATVFALILSVASMINVGGPVPGPSRAEVVLNLALPFLVFLASLAPFFVPETRRLLQVLGVTWAIVGCAFFVLLVAGF